MANESLAHVAWFCMVLGLGGALLALGLASGWWLARWLRPASAASPDHDRQHISSLLGDLHLWTNAVATDVSEYRTHMELLAGQFADETSQSTLQLSPPTRNLILQMLEANRQLQARLDTAEAALQEQSSDIAAYISQARTDALTSVSNRRVFDETLAAALAAWNAQGKPVCVMLFDIDHFKLLNDTRGHLAGDAVLRDLAQLLRESAPAGAMIARYGGEEFACISMAGDVHHAAELADYFRQVVESNLFLYEREAIRVTMSCGVAQAVYREDALSLLKRCDSALYSAKSVGRNVVYWHDGYHCVAYQSRDAMPVTQTDPANRVVEDFQDLCKDLRNKLAQISVRNEVHATPRL